MALRAGFKQPMGNGRGGRRCSTKERETEGGGMRREERRRGGEKEGREKERRGQRGRAKEG